MWCPNCKMEYRKGIRVCADCGAELVEGTEADFCTVDLCEFKDEAVADRFLEYLHYSGLEEASKEEKEEVFVVSVPEKQRKKAEKLFHGFLLAIKEEQETEVLQELQKQMQQEEDGAEPEDSGDDAEQADEETEYDWDQEEQETDPDESEPDSDAENLMLSEEAEEDTGDLLYTSTESYVTKEEEYKDLKFSGITFIAFSILGGIFLTLCQLEILPIRYEKFVFIVIALVFIAFLIIGIVSMVKASKVKLQIPEEEQKTKEIYGYLDEELSRETVDAWKDPEVTEVENDLLITAKIRSMLVKAYPEESAIYLEYLADQYYGEHYMDHDETEETAL